MLFYNKNKSKQLQWQGRHWLVVELYGGNRDKLNAQPCQLQIDKIIGGVSLPIMMDSKIWIPPFMDS